MSTSTLVRQLRSEIDRLERKLADMTRLLEGGRAPLPSRPFEALVIAIDGVRLVVPLEDVRELVPLPWPTPLPDAPSSVLGTFRYGDAIVPLIDFRARLFGVPTELDFDDVVLVLDRPRWLGLVAPVPECVLTIDPADLEPVAPNVEAARYLLASVAGRFSTGALLLSVERLGHELSVRESR